MHNQKLILSTKAAISQELRKKMEDETFKAGTLSEFSVTQPLNSR